MTADYNGWNDAPEAEREAIDDYTRQEFEREALAELAELQKMCPPAPEVRKRVGLRGPQAGSLRPHKLLLLVKLIGGCDGASVRADHDADHHAD
jgi:hypothetical protein